MLSISKICPLCVQKAQNPPKFFPKPSQNLFKTLPKRPQIHPEALSEPILWAENIYLPKMLFFYLPGDGQKHPKEAQDGPEPLPNTAQDPPKIDFCWIFRRLLSSSKFAMVFPIFFHYFLQPELLKTMVFLQ